MHMNKTMIGLVFALIFFFIITLIITFYFFFSNNSLLPNDGFFSSRDRVCSTSSDCRLFFDDCSMIIGSFNNQYREKEYALEDSQPCLFGFGEKNGIAVCQNRLCVVETLDAKKHTYEDCVRAESPETCRMRIAIEKKDLSLCENFSNNGCREAIYKQFTDVGSCETLANVEAKDACYKIIGKRERDERICKRIQDSPTQRECLFYIAPFINKLEYCSLFFRAQRNIQEESCMLPIAVATGNTAICEQMTERNSKNLCFKTVIPNIASEEDKKTLLNGCLKNNSVNCMNNVIFQNIFSYADCDLLPDDETGKAVVSRQDCLDQKALHEKNASQCSDDPVSGNYCRALIHLDIESCKNIPDKSSGFFIGYDDGVAVNNPCIDQVARQKQDPSLCVWLENDIDALYCRQNKSTR